MNPVLAALMIPFLGTVLGSAFVFFMKRDMPVASEASIDSPEVRWSLRRRNDNLLVSLCP